jgi:CRISPR-associated protein Csm2
MKENEVKKWIQNGITVETISAVERFASEITNAEKKAENVSTSQIRQIFTKLKSIEAKGYSGQEVEFLMLKPMIAYTAGRHKLERLNKLKKVVTAGIDAVTEADKEKQKDHFNNFCRFFEAILAYHRAHGGD